ncbi:hypothetical protein Tco_0651009 [Tanacetum coccineum]
MLRLKCKQIEMIEHESKPLKKKDQILIDEEIVQNLQAQLNAELEEEEKLTKQSEEDENIAQEQEELTVEEKLKLFIKLMDKRKKHFAGCQLKNKSFDEVQKAFDKTMGWIDSFVSMDSEVVKGGKEKDEGSQKLDESVEVEVDDETELKRHIEIVVDEEEIAVDAIPLSTKSPIIVD